MFDFPKILGRLLSAIEEGRVPSARNRLPETYSLRWLRYHDIKLAERLENVKENAGKGQEKRRDV
jgi:hypothetical protein